MKSLPIALALLGLAAPVLAQDLNPAITGDGTQVQGVDLLDGAVSIEVQSSGSASLGRGEDHMEGDLGITVNDLNLGTVGETDDGPARSSQGNGTPSNGAVAPGPQTNSALTATSQRPDSDDCTFQSASDEDLAWALDHDLPLILREATCPDASLVDWSTTSNPMVRSWIARANLSPDRVVSITIDNGAVIIDHTPKS